MDHEQGAILVAGIAESPELGRPKKFHEWTAAMNAQHHLNLKLKLMGADAPPKPLNPPRKISNPAAMIRPGSAEESGVPEHAKSAIDTFCQEWAAATKEPFATLVAKNGVIITHASFGTDSSGKSIDLDYRCWVASITKTMTAIMFSQLVDQGLIELDWTLDRVFPDYPANASYVPTFRQLLEPHQRFKRAWRMGWMFNPHLENIVLNGIDVNEPERSTNTVVSGLNWLPKQWRSRPANVRREFTMNISFRRWGCKTLSWETPAPMASSRPWN